MPALIPPHGGLTEPIDRIDPKLADSVQQLGQSAPRLVVQESDIATLNRIADGGLSPLTGPMSREQYQRVLDEQTIVNSGKKYAWTIPLSLPATADEIKFINPGTEVVLVSEAGKAIGILRVTDVFVWDKAQYNQRVYQTERTDHPGARIALSDPRTHLVGGELTMAQPERNPHYGDLILTPKQTRELFAKRGFQRVVAFQTRNPLHRAHEYALVVGLERLTREGHFAGAVLNPLVGETKGDDVDAVTRMKTYRALIDNKVLGQGDIDEELWKKVDRKFSDQVLLLGLDIKMFYAGPNEAVMHAIYRQNYGFTDIVIGRKHADAPYDDGTDIWDGLAAQRKFDELNGELLIKPVKVGFAAFYAELGRVGLVDEHAPKGWKPVSISGRDLREKLKAGELPDPRIMRPETAKVLIERIKAG